MFQKGPGEGYMAAKADVLRCRPQAKCHRYEHGYAIYVDGKLIAGGATARHAWNNALDKLRTKGRRK